MKTSSLLTLIIALFVFITILVEEIGETLKLYGSGAPPNSTID